MLVACHGLVDLEVQQASNNNQQQAASNQQPPTNNQQPTANNQQPATSNQQPATNTQQPATSNRQPTTNSQQPATNGWRGGRQRDGRRVAAFSNGLPRRSFFEWCSSSCIFLPLGTMRMSVWFALAVMWLAFGVKEEGRDEDVAPTSDEYDGLDLQMGLFAALGECSSSDEAEPLPIQPPLQAVDPLDLALNALGVPNLFQECAPNDWARAAKKAFKQASLLCHPDKGGDPRIMLLGFVRSYKSWLQQLIQLVTSCISR